MDEKIVYTTVRGNTIVLAKDDYDYEVLLNGMQVMSTGDGVEAEIVAESLDIALSILSMQKKLKDE